ncbi:uncharacterized protein [Diadema antillarum]|uniref:uncharacterized protein n=1 Tax=Diadema antillarum TaxID=105358 RepID=UPI003A85D9BB
MVPQDFVTSELMDTDSEEFQDLQNEVAMAFTVAVNSTSEHINVVITELRNGSVIASLVINVTGTEQVVNDLVAVIMSVDADSLTAASNGTLSISNAVIGDVIDTTPDGTATPATSTASAASPPTPSMTTAYLTTVLTSARTTAATTTVETTAANTTVETTAANTTVEATTVDTTLATTVASTEEATTLVNSTAAMDVTTDEARTTAEDASATTAATPPCQSGMVLRAGSCANTERVTANITIQTFRGQALLYVTAELMNRSSHAFLDLQNEIELAIIAAINSIDDNVDVVIVDLRNGSVIATLDIDVYGNNQQQVDNLASDVRGLDSDAVTAASNGTLNVSNVIVDVETDLTTPVATPTPVCSSDLILRAGACVNTAQVSANITIERSRGTDLPYVTTELMNMSSSAFLDLQSNIEMAIIEAIDSTDDNVDVVITALINGSVTAFLDINVYGTSQQQVDDLIGAIRGLNVESVNEAANGTFLISSIVVEGAPTTDDGVLDPAVIVGIILGCVSFFFLATMAGICCMYVAYSRRTRLAKVLMSNRDDGGPVRNYGYWDGDDDDQSSEYSLDHRREAVRRAIDQINMDRDRHLRAYPPVVRWNRPFSEGFHSDDNFSTPYVADGSESSSMSVERNPMARGRRYNYY